MKNRLGFVSNSSSSSFIVGYKGKSFAEVAQNLKKDNDNAITTKLLDAVIQSLKSNIEEIFTEIDVFARSADELGYEPDFKEYKKIIQLLKEGYTISIGSVSDESDYDSIDNYLAHTELKYKDDNLYIETEGGY